MNSGSQTFLGFLLFIALVVYVYLRNSKRKPKTRKNKTSFWNDLFKLSNRPEQTKSPYKVKPNLMTNNERKFFFALGEYVGKKAYICPMVGLKDIFTVEVNNRSEYQTHLNKIWRKHVDFVLVTPDEELRVICGIELDDSTHNRESAKIKDRFKDQVFNEAGVPLIRFKPWGYYSEDNFNKKLGMILGIVPNYERTYI